MRKRKGIAVIAAIVMTAVMSLGGSLAAATTTVGISDGAAAVALNQTIVGFGGYEWWVIGDAKRGVVSPRGGVILLSKNADFGVTAFHSEATYKYKDSMLYKRMNEKVNSISNKESNQIRNTQLTDTDGKTFQQKLWPLSKDEYDKIGNNYIAINVKTYGRDYWLRSNEGPWHFGWSNGSRTDAANTYHTMAARPALDLELRSVILTSNAGQTGKAAAAVNGVPISLAAPVTTGTNNKIKYTFADDSLMPGDGGLELGNVSVSKVEANKATVKYDGATEKKNLSFVVKNGKGESTHYGKLAEKINGEGEASLDITNIDLSQNTIHLFTEEINGENLSDFATTPKALNIDLSTIKQVAVTGGDGGGSYTEGVDVELTASKAPQGKRFKGWEISPKVMPTQGTSFEEETIKFTMPGEDVTATALYENVYTVTVNNGSIIGGIGEYAEGEEVMLTANPAAAGKRFKRWEISPEVTLTKGSLTSEEIGFKMPKKAVTATAEYENVYTVTVNNGTISGGREYAEGEEVTLTADPAPEGKYFKGWSISPEVTLTEGTNTISIIKFDMPAEDVTATAVYEDVYTVTVIGGTVSGGREYAEGEEVTLTANIAAAGKRFKRWEISPEVTLTKGNLTDETITFIMPGEDVTATAEYEDVHTVTVIGGTVSGGREYAEGEEVTLTANPAPEGKYFKGWNISPAVTLKDGTTVTSSIIKFDMPDENVTATAVYEDLIVYPIKDSDNSTWNPGDEGGLIITSVGEHRKFTGVTVDGNTVDRQHYTVESGSTIVTLKASYLSTLSVGEHVLRIHFTDGYTETRFNVQEVQTDKPTPPTTDPDKPTPPTTDPDNPNPPTTDPVEPNPPVNPGEPTSPVNPPVNPNEPTSPVNPPIQPGEPNQPAGQGGTTAATTVANVGTSPKTGDSNRIWIMVSLMLGTGVGFMAVSVLKKRKGNS